MGDTYDSTSNIHAQLGPASSGNDEAMNVIRKQLKRLTTAIQQSLCALFNRPYWTRLWVVYEIILGLAHKIRVNCGSKLSSVQESIMCSRLTTANRNCLLRFQFGF
jgi:hypothetical protein